MAVNGVDGTEIAPRPHGFHAAVKEAARSEGQTASEFIRQAIRAQLQRTEAAQTAPCAGSLVGK